MNSKIKENGNKTKFKEKEYELLLQVRNFHYESFNKWMTFYYIAVGSIFIAFYSGKLDETKICITIVMGAINKYLMASFL